LIKNKEKRKATHGNSLFFSSSLQKYSIINNDGQKKIDGFRDNFALCDISSYSTNESSRDFVAIEGLGTVQIALLRCRYKLFPNCSHSRPGERRIRRNATAQDTDTKPL
jgi:hypothetical protein